MRIRDFEDYDVGHNSSPGLLDKVAHQVSGVVSKGSSVLHSMRERSMPREILEGEEQRRAENEGLSLEQRDEGFCRSKVTMHLAEAIEG